MQYVVHCGVYASRLRDRAPSISGLRFRCGVGGLLACLLACMCVLFPLLHVYSINRTNTASSPFHLYAEYEDIAFLLISIRWFAFACSHSRMHGRTTTQTASFLPSCPLPTAGCPLPWGWAWGLGLGLNGKDPLRSCARTADITFHYPPACMQSLFWAGRLVQCKVYTDKRKPNSFAGCEGAS